MAEAHSTPIYVTVDRFERDAQGRKLAVLVLDDEQQLVVPQSALPTGSRRGELLLLTLAPARQETQVRAERVGRLQRKLFG